MLVKMAVRWRTERRRSVISSASSLARSHNWPQRPNFNELITASLIFASLCWTTNGQQAAATTRTVPQQRFALEPTDRTAVVGSNILLPCRVENRRGNIQWTRDGFGLGQERILAGFPRYSMTGSDEEEDFSLKIDNVNLEDDAQFQCQVGAAEGTKGIRSKTAHLTVYVPPEPPKIVQGDILQTTAGITVELTCESHAGKPAAELSWLDGDASVVKSNLDEKKNLMADGKRFNSVSKWTLTPGRQHDGKTFKCRAENPALSQPLYAEIKLEVKYPPEISLKVNSDKIIEFDDVTFTCEALANPADVVYKWYRNDEIINGDYTTTLTIRKVTREYNKQSITCEVGNTVGTTKSTHTLNVHFGPVMRSLAENVAVDLGEAVKLVCDVDGNPKPEIKWFFQTKHVASAREYSIKNMTPDLAGKYTCRATVPDFPETISEMAVFIKGPPSIISPKTQYGIEGDLVRLECLINSVPPPNRVVWTKNGKVVDIDNSEGYEIVQEDIANGLRNSLVIRKASDSDFGEYNCTVSNTFGDRSAMFSLQKQKSLPMLIILAGVIGGIVFIVSVTIVIILCLRRKSIVKDDDYSSEKKTKQSDSGSSGDSDIKVEIRTASSLSNTEHERSWEDNSDTTRTQDAQDIYKYAAEYTDPGFPPKPETQNNNGYIPYVDYSRDYNPPPSSVQLTPSRDTTYDSASHQSLNDLAPIVDPRYNAGYANPYLRTSQSNLPPPQGVYLSPRGSVASGGPAVPGAPVLGHGRYITAQQSHLKPGTLATHV